LRIYWRSCRSLKCPNEYFCPFEIFSELDSSPSFVLIFMKSTPDFHFKQFSVKQARSSHKVGTDGVLLGAWVNVEGVQHVLDVGTGSGVIALILAQRTSPNSKIQAVEIEETDVEQAKENILNSPWPDKVEVFHSSIQQFQNTLKYDLIVSNPPYFQNSWLPPEKNRSTARHTHELSFDDLLQSASRLLSEAGRLAIILPYTEAMDLIARARLYYLNVLRQLHFRSRSHKPVERILVELHRGPANNHIESLVLHSEHDKWSDEYRDLTKDFYLKL
jgi:tRNA1Val (adenine37-N6)-methyltransferase